MPGNYKPVVVFPFPFDRARAARIQLEPFVCVHCYGMSVKVILELVSGSGDKSFVYERIAAEENITQENVKDGFMSAPFIEVMEGFYFNKTDIPILIPVCALLLKIYFRPIIDAFDIDLSAYINDIEYLREDVGFKSKAINNVPITQTNKSSYKTEAISTPYSNNGNDQKETKASCRQIIQSIQKKKK